MSPAEPTEHRPCVRPLDVHATVQDGRKGLALADRLGIADGMAFLPEGLLPVVSLFDGTRTVAEIEAALRRSSGLDLPAGFVQGVAEQLDERLLLKSERFQVALGAAVTAFLDQEHRPCRHAGSASYPQDPHALREALTAIVGTRTPLRSAPQGLVAPHIDLLRGREGYAQAYGWLAECEPADLYVVFGTGHQGPSAPVTGLVLDWQTPLGTVGTDREFVTAVHREIGGPLAEDLFLHREEHSLEFQVLFLHHVLGQRPFEVACFLTGALPSSNGDPGEEEYVRRLLDAFRSAVAGSGKRVCFIGGADLAHLGPFFGDQQPVDASLLSRLRRDEERKIERLLADDPGGFHREVEANGNADRICGVSPIYLTAALAGTAGELLHYGQATAPDGHQVVSFCAVGFPSVG